MGYCGRHSLDHKSATCPRCRAEERHQELIDVELASLEATIETAQQSDYKRANPGDHLCPHCKYISLKYDASRCPLCHGQIETEYWNRVRTEQRAAAERHRLKEEADAAEERRMAPIRAAAAATAAARAETNERWTIFSVVYSAYLLPALTLFTSISVLTSMEKLPSDFSRGDFVLFLIPVLNWLMCLTGVVLADSPTRPVTAASLLAWATVGGIVYVSRLSQRHS